jgi:hypothetical protein
MKIFIITIAAVRNKISNISRNTLDWHCHQDINPQSFELRRRIKLKVGVVSSY